MSRGCSCGSLKNSNVSGIDQAKASVVLREGLNLASLSSSLLVLSCGHSEIRCITVSGAEWHRVQSVSFSGWILVLKVFRLLCPVIISTSSFRSVLESFSICLLYLGSVASL